MFDVSSKGRVQVHRVDTWEEKCAYLREKDTAASITSGTVHFSAPQASKIGRITCALPIPAGLGRMSCAELTRCEVWVYLPPSTSWRHEVRRARACWRSRGGVLQRNFTMRSCLEVTLWLAAASRHLSCQLSTRQPRQAACRPERRGCRARWPQPSSTSGTAVALVVEPVNTAGWRAVASTGATWPRCAGQIHRLRIGLDQHFKK